MRWLRLYSEVLHDPKVLQLRPEMRWYWVACLCLANVQKASSKRPANVQQTSRGRLPSVQEMATSLRIKPSKAKAIVDRLISVKLIDKDDCGNLVMHNWDARQPRACARARSDSELDSESETESSSSTPPARDDDISIPSPGADPACWAAALKRSRRLKKPPDNLRSWLWITAQDYQRSGIPRDAPEPPPPPERTYHRADPEYIARYQAMVAATANGAKPHN